ncbi:DNA cytosine methyltransferase [Horticoccus luteus]|uniref:Cytosine-specific methyltransferase n=1 Tax=Horticoccus luteus TaxID=2862869 RepID=A0A8F9TTH5_9BACT|nr:DNA cytosine methyltransferase [Horticoccus luteus]QYM78959.1 DNA cytosine methyltransferase [Horticoccus luteus]
MSRASLTFIDLFSGCGGFTLGMLRAGFDCLAAIDFNEQAIATLRTNLQAKSPTSLPPVAFALHADLTQLRPDTLAAMIGSKEVDVIVGGPPCQGFSTARQRDGSNHGDKRLKDDPRRHLFRNFLDHVEHFQPKVFVIENVLGLRSAAGGRYFTAVQYEARSLGKTSGRPGYRVHPQIERGTALGVPQKRRRQLIVGVRADLPGYFPAELAPAPRALLATMLGDAILDLPVLAAGAGEHETPYDLKRRQVHFLGGTRDRWRKRYLSHVAEVGASPAIYNHVARPHSARDLGDFLKLAEGESSAAAMRRGVEFDFPYDKTTFKDRYTRQHRNKPCSTIVAHLSKDGLMFIHPVQNRSLTPREAARVQSFPDWFVFPEARTHAFRVIGNAVPPLIAEGVGRAIRSFLSPEIAAPTARPTRGHHSLAVAPAFALPSNRTEAITWLDPLTRADRKALRAMTAAEFLRGWHALLWLFPELHPENALEHGDEEHDAPLSGEAIDRLGRRYTRSGWPVMLEGFGTEAWRRYLGEEFSDEAFYCIEAQRAGLDARRCTAARAPATAPMPTPVPPGR